MKRKTLNQDEIAILLAVLDYAGNQGYATLQKNFGSIGTDRLLSTETKLRNWYYKNVLHYHYDRELGWINPSDEY